jgi:catalase
MDEDQQLAFGFDVLDPTKFIPEELVPITPLGGDFEHDSQKLLRRDRTDRGKLLTNIYTLIFCSNTSQFQSGHVVRGIDFSDDPVLQGRLYSYLDAQLNRYRGPNFEQTIPHEPTTSPNP